MAAEGIPLNHPDASSDHREGDAYYQNLPPAPPPSAGQGQWSTGLCDCFSDVPHCCFTCWCPFITFGQTAEIVDRGQSTCGTSGALYALIMSLTGCQWIYSWSYRTKMMTQYGILESDMCADCCVHFWCEPCALCQESRELKYRGYDPALGWHLNMERQAQGATMAPPAAPGGMTRYD